MPRLGIGDAPYYIVPEIRRLKTLPASSPEAARLRLLVSVNIGDPVVAQKITGEKQEDSGINTRKIENSEKDENPIDTFLNKFGANLQPIGYIPDTPPAEKEAPVSLRQLIKEHRYQEALEFIKLQNLNNPKKSIYFAHQMRFIKKLQAIENYRNKQKAGQQPVN